MLTCETGERLLADALYDALDTDRQNRLERHLKHCRACRRLQSELEAANRTLVENGLCAGRCDDIPERAGLDALWERLQPALDRADAERYRQLPRSNSFVRPSALLPYLAGALATAASLLVFVLVFDLSLQKTDPGSDMAQSISATEAGDAELMNYLRRVETMLMAVANAQSSNEAAVPVQQTFARTMALEAGALTTNHEESIKSGQSRLLKDIEYMLMQIANLDDDNLEQGVLLLQSYIEENNILFRIRLMEMRQSDTVI